MKVRYFEDTDTLHVELSDLSVIETKELNENIYFLTWPPTAGL